MLAAPSSSDVTSRKRSDVCRSSSHKTTRQRHKDITSHHHARHTTPQSTTPHSTITTALSPPTAAAHSAQLATHCSAARPHMAERLAPSQRHAFVHGGRLIYEWEQTLTEVNMFVPVPPDMRAKEIFCDIDKQHLKFGRQGNPPFLDLDLYEAVKVSECIWTLEDHVLHISLTKLEQGEPWPAVIKGHALDPMKQQQDQQRLLLERFQREHPGFDFSNATFNGEAPNARKFMGGLSSDATRS